jgi:hypothetical protein
MVLLLALSFVLAAGFQLPANDSAVRVTMTEVRTLTELRAWDWKLIACYIKLVAHSTLCVIRVEFPCASGPAVNSSRLTGYGREVPGTEINPSTPACNKTPGSRFSYAPWRVEGAPAKQETDEPGHWLQSEAGCA